VLAVEMTVAEPLGGAMATAPEAAQGVTPAGLRARHEMTPAGLRARHEMTPVALHATLEAAAVRATLESTMGAAAEPNVVGRESHRQREVRRA